MVSTHTAVLPVLRSPMISWRWPRPIGVCIDRLDAGLQRLTHALALHHRRSLEFQRAPDVRLDVAAAVDRLAQRVDDASEERVADRHREHLAGALDLLALFDLLEVAEDHRADAVLVEVERDAEHAAGELQQFLRHHRGEALDVRDTVTGVDDRADLFALGVGVKLATYPRSRPGCRRGDRQLCHGFSSSCSYGVGLVVSSVSRANGSRPRPAWTTASRRSPRRRRRSTDRRAALDPRGAEVKRGDRRCG